MRQRRKPVFCGSRNNIFRHSNIGTIISTPDSKFSTQSECRKSFICKVRYDLYQSFKISERHHFGDNGVIAWINGMLPGQTSLHIFDANSVTTQRYRDEGHYVGPL
ncbi:hypothetical protein AVEN_72211-1 [Araneus ventricosus]|uniref:Uncharacterized protein n=1 Tax=Araneus ventricosus TaxID=182803 RepID=A0A4Y2HET7_ARAVE|nr:hypothetical protein AVEN_72211-1 [Araneus ventricosus]